SGRPRDRVARELFPVGLRDVACHLVEALVPADGGDLWRRASGLGQPTTRSLAESMRRESLEADAHAPRGKPLPELLGGETTPALVEQKRDVLARCRGIDGLGEFGGDWDRERRFGLLRRHLNRPVADVTAPELDDIGATQRRAEHKLQGQPRLGAHGEGGTERGNVLLAPGLVAVALRHLYSHVSGGIISSDSDV